MNIEDIINTLTNYSFNPDDLQEEIYGIIEALEAHQKEDKVIKALLDETLNDLKLCQQREREVNLMEELGLP